MRVSGALIAAVLSMAPGAGAQRSDGLPADLILVPRGEVRVGRTAAEILGMAEQLHPDAGERRRRALRQMVPELGRAVVAVEPFYLSRVPVTNAQYRVFVKATGHRPPFHWWKRGVPEHHRALRGVFRSENPGRLHPDLIYWEMHAHELPHGIPEGEEEQPVGFVSWHDARAFAGWAGMRLPTETEWLWAATAGGVRELVTGARWDPAWIRALGLERRARLRAVGTLGAPARGPFGHDDLAGNVWEWLDHGFEPLAGREAFAAELEVLRRSRPDLEWKDPPWDDGVKVLKGGSRFSWMNPVELRVGTRCPLAAHQTVEVAGFRPCKSPAAGRDLAAYRLSIDFDTVGMVAGHDLGRQVGVERYDLARDGRWITGYHAVSLVPARHLGHEDGAMLSAVVDRLRRRPGPVATLVTTEEVASPKLAPGTYAISCRAGRGSTYSFVFTGVDGHSVALAADGSCLSLSTGAPTSAVRLVARAGEEVLEFSFGCPVGPDGDRHLVLELSLQLTRSSDPRRPWRH